MRTWYDIMAGLYYHFGRRQIYFNLHSVAIDVEPSYLDHVPNRVLAAQYAKHWAAVPLVNDIPNPPLKTTDYTWIKISTDQSNLSHIMPSINVSFAIPPGPGSGANHSPDFEKSGRDPWRLPTGYARCQGYGLYGHGSVHDTGAS